MPASKLSAASISMAPHGDSLGLQAGNTALSMDSAAIQRTISDISSFELNSSSILPPISEIEDAKCECCGMSEECTPQYVRKVREKYCGKMICGLCSEAVKEEMDKKGGEREEALQAHLSTCAKFNRLGRAYPVLLQAQAMREILRKNNNSSRSKSLSPRDHDNINHNNQKKKIITRSSSCMPAISKEMTMN